MGVWEIGNTASDHFFPTAPEVSCAAWYDSPADNKQSGQNQVAGTHPDPLARTDILGYRELYAALNLLSPV